MKAVIQDMVCVLSIMQQAAFLMLIGLFIVSLLSIICLVLCSKPKLAAGMFLNAHHT